MVRSFHRTDDARSRLASETKPSQPNEVFEAAHRLLVKAATLCPAWVRRYGLRAVLVYFALELAFIAPEMRYHFLERLAQLDVYELSKLATLLKQF
jgi:hypothetical protein